MSTSEPGLKTEEYQRRKLFLDQLKGLTTPEYVEIIRILKAHLVHYSENQNGIFFNVASLPQTTFDELEKFLHFTQMNRHNLLDRDVLLSTLMHSPMLEEVIGVTEEGVATVAEAAGQ